MKATGGLQESRSMIWLLGLVSADLAEVPVQGLCQRIPPVFKYPSIYGIL